MSMIVVDSLYECYVEHRSLSETAYI